MSWNPRTWLFGEIITAAKLNEIRDLLNACAPGKVSEAGQIPVSIAANVLAGLTAPTVSGKVLRSDLTKSQKMTWDDDVSPLSFDYFDDGNTHSYGAAVWRDMPNTSKVITLAKQSTVLCLGGIYEYGTTGKTYAFFNAKFNIGGTDIDFGLAKRHYGISEKDTVPIFGYRTGVAAGSCTIKIREKCDADGYTVDGKTYIVVVIPEE